MGLDQKEIFSHRYGPWGVIAGASEGLGAAFAEALAARNMNLVLIARRTSLLQDLAARLERQFSIRLLPISLDLSHPNSFNQIVRDTQALEIGLLVYNAGFSVEGPFLGHPLADHLAEIDTNVRMPLQLLYHFGSRMAKNQRGGVILMTSLSAFQGSAYISNYSATKAFNLVLAEGLWQEWRQKGVDVLACAAGAVRTPNYLASRPHSAGRLADATLEPDVVVVEALAALGKKQLVIPGKINRLSSFMMRHLLPRRLAVTLMGSVLRKMYVDEKKKGD